MAEKREQIIAKFKKSYEKEKSKGKWSKEVNDAYDKVINADQILSDYATNTAKDRETVKNFRDVVVSTRSALKKCWEISDKYNKSLEEYEKVRKVTTERLDKSAQTAMIALQELGVDLTPREQRALFYILDDAPFERFILPDMRKFPSDERLGKQFPTYTDSILSKRQLILRLIGQFERAIESN